MTPQQQLLEWLRSSAQGDQAAFESLYQATSAKLFAVSLQLMRRRDWAEDVLQDAFIKIWHNAGDYHTEKGTVMTWMISITRYRALDLLKSRKVKAEHIELDESWMEALHTGEFTDPAADKARLEFCMEGLESDHRQSIYLAFVNGLSHQEITQYISAPLGSIKSWIRRGLAKLKKVPRSMNYLEQERQDALAVSYVLGSMRGKARLRFQGLLMQHLSLRQAVWRWERHLNPVVEQLKPVMPDASVWQRVTIRLGWRAPEQAPPTSSRSYWKETFAVAMAACLALVLLLPQIDPVLPTPVPAQLAIVQNSQAQALWVVKWEQQQLKVQATAAVQPLTDADYELWMLPDNGQPPISLGLLPQQANTERALPPSVNGLKVAALAVSLEPKGGSPTGQPTGPVLHTAQLVQL